MQNSCRGLARLTVYVGESDPSMFELEGKSSLPFCMDNRRKLSHLCSAFVCLCRGLMSYMNMWLLLLILIVGYFVVQYCKMTFLILFLLLKITSQYTINNLYVFPFMYWSLSAIIQFNQVFSKCTGRKSSFL